MLNNYFKIAFRHIQKHKLYNILNVAGLVIAFTCSLLIMLYLKSELSYDRYHKNADTIYRVVQKQPNNLWRGTDMWNATSSKLKPAILENIHEVENATSVCCYGTNGHILHNGNNYVENKVFFVEPEFLEIFSFPLLRGDIQTALDKPNSILLTKQKVKKYFDNQDPIGKVLQIGDINYTVTGILKDIPANSHFTFDFLASFQDIRATEWGQSQGGTMRWNSNNFSTYIQVQEDADPKKLGEKITAMVQRVSDLNLPNTFQLQKVTDIHLHSNVNREFETNSDIKYVYIFSAIAILLIIIAGFNYMNLTTVQTLFFAKEARVRRISGANRKQISFQFIGEAILLAVLAFGISILLVQLFIPVFSSFTEKSLSIKMLFTQGTIALSLLVVISVGLISGSYPAFRLARQQTVPVLKNQSLSGTKNIGGIRNSLIVFQFIISTTLIIGSLVLYKQLHFVQNKKLGYQKENIISIPVEDFELRKNYYVFKDELIKHPGVLDVTYTQTNLDFNMHGGACWWEGKSPEDQINFYSFYTDYNFIDFFNIDLVEGRTFSPDIRADADNAYILNKTAIEKIGWNNPLAKSFSQNEQLGNVIGIVDDFNFQSLRLGIEPLVIKVGVPEYQANCISVKITSFDIPGTLGFIEDTYRSMSPGFAYSFSFLDEKLDDLYRTDQKQGKIFSIFTAIALFVAGLGLFGLASFIAKQKTKEIGIRKVNGAKISEVMIMLNKDFVKWVAIAFVIAVPIAYYAMNKWLESFAYKTELSWWIFALAGALALGIALLTVSWQSWRAATRNPVEALRYE